MGGRERPKKDGSEGAKKKGAWRGMLSHRRGSSNAASAHGVGEETPPRTKTMGDHSSTRGKHTSKRDTKKAEGAAPTKRDTKKAGAPPSIKRDTRKAQGAAPTKRDANKAGGAPSTSDSASASVPSLKRAGSKKKTTGNNKEQDFPDVDNNAKTKPKTKAKTKRRRSDHDTSNESADDVKAVGDDNNNKWRTPKKSEKRPTAGATAGTRKYSSASSSLAQESTGRSLESSQSYFSAESESSHVPGSERERSQDGKKEAAVAAAAREDSVARSSDRRNHRSRSSRGRRKSDEIGSSVSLDDESSVSVDGRAGKKLEKRSSARLVARKTSDTTSDGSDGGGGGGAEGGGTQAVGNKAKKKTTPAAAAAEATKAPPPQPDVKKREKSESTRRRRSSHSNASPRSTERDGREEKSEVKCWVIDVILSHNAGHSFDWLLWAPSNAEQSHNLQHDPPPVVSSRQLCSSVRNLQFFQEIS